MSDETVKVAVRVRPFNLREKEIGGESVVTMGKTANGEVTEVTVPNGGGSHKFTFDHSFWSMDPEDPKFASQEDVFTAVGLPVVENVMAGFNSTVFAYGQTGSGKTYSMMGAPGDEGLTPRLCQNMFDQITEIQEKGGNGYKIAIETSYYEIYNEKVFDLLAKPEKGKEQKALQVRNSPAIGPYVKGLKSFAVENFAMVEELINEGLDARHVSATAMNAGSSRSHAVFVLQITQQLDDGSGEASDDLEKTSKLNLVDLAGSERQNKTKATGARLQEGSNINKSLSTLGMVINGLCKGGTHVPYRDSALTWLLKESFGGNAKTVMVATLSPSADNTEETLSTLRYADNAKQIKNNAVINEGASAKIIRELKEQIEKLKAGEGGPTEHGGDADHTLADQLAEAQALLNESTLSLEAKLERTRVEMEERLKVAEDKAHQAVIDAERSRERANHKNLEFMGLKWKATAHINAVERKLSELNTGSEASSESQTELEQKLAMERLKAKQLEEQLAALQAQQKSAQETHGEFAMNKKEIALLQKIAGGGTMDDHEIDSVMGQIAELRNTDLQHSPEHKFAPSGAAEAAAAVVATGPEDGNSSEGDDNDGEDHNPYNPFAEHMPGAPADAEVSDKGEYQACMAPGMMDPSQVMPDAYGDAGRRSQQINLTGMPPEAAQKLMQMQNQLAKAKRALSAATRGKGTTQGASLYKDLLLRRRDIFSASRGIKPKRDPCLRSYVIMTCKTAASVLAEGDMGSNLVHGGVRLSKIACAGTLQKKGGVRHNWSVRWFLFDLRNRTIAYFSDSSLKKIHGTFHMNEVLSCLNPPDLAPGADAEKVMLQRKKFLVVTPKRTWQLMAPTIEAKELWISVFTSIISEESKARELHDDIAQQHS